MKPTRLLFSVLVMASISSVAMASAAPPVTKSNPWYVGLRTGGSFPMNSNQNSMSTSHFPGYIGLAEAGYEFGTWYAVEVEGGYLRSTVKDIQSAGLTTTWKEQSTSAWLGMLNGYFKYKNTSRFVPYVGLGIGAEALNVNWRFGTQPMNVGGQTLAGYYKVKGIKGLFAYQAIIGSAINLDKHWSISFDYRFLGTINNQRFGSTLFTTPQPPVAPQTHVQGGKYVRFNTNLITFGVDYHFDM